MFEILSFVLGLCLGSFYNVCVFRYLSGESVVLVRSHCPVCRHFLSWWENVPLASYVLLRGRCRDCHEKISPQYPIMELLSGLWALALALKFGPSLLWVAFMVLGGILLIVSFIDLHSFILPDFLVLPGTALALVAAATVLPNLSLQDSIIGAIAGSGSFLVLLYGYFAVRGIQGLGMGDVKLMLLLGAMLGWQGLPITILLAAITGLAGSLLYMHRHREQGLQVAIPFGPFLAFGGMIYVLLGQEIMFLISA